MTGRTGQVAQSLAERGAAAGHTIVAVGRPDLDLATADADAVLAALAATAPDAIVSAAAHTAVDRAESEPDLSFAINATAAGHIAAAGAALGVPVLHLSTDYVFAGDKPAPYLESDATGPQGVYGASKLAGEEAVLAAHPGALVLRTAWVTSPFGSNFVRTMLRLAATRDEIGVVADQRGNPTSALDIADALLALAVRCAADPDPALRGVFHLTASGETTWAGLAEATFARSAAHGGPSARVRPIATADYPTPARRPANSRLDGGRLLRVHGLRLPDWETALETTVARLVASDHRSG